MLALPVLACCSRINFRRLIKKQYNVKPCLLASFAKNGKRADGWAANATVLENEGLFGLRLNL